jgi:hypothetical protein
MQLAHRCAIVSARKAIERVVDVAGQAYYLRIETSAGRLLDQYPSEDEAKAALTDMQRQLSERGVETQISTQSGKIMFARKEFKTASIVPVQH